jgi:uncharacterized membrane protein (TIGR02234 family)
MSPQRGLGSSVVACLVGAGLAIYGATRVWSVDVTERPGLTSLRATTTGAAEAPWLIGLALVGLAGAGALLATRGLPRRLLGVLLAMTGIGLIIAAITGRAGLDPGAAGAGATVWPIACVLGGGLVGWGGLGAARHGHRWPTMGSRYDRRSVPPSVSPPTPGPTAGSTATRDSGGPHVRGGSTERDTESDDATARSGEGAAASGAASAASGTGPADTVADQAKSEPEPNRAEPAPAEDEDRPAAIASVDTRAAWDALDRGDDPTVR